MRTVLERQVRQVRIQGKEAKGDEKCSLLPAPK